MWSAIFSRIEHRASVLRACLRRAQPLTCSHPRQTLVGTFWPLVSTPLPKQEGRSFCCANVRITAPRPRAAMVIRRAPRRAGHSPSRTPAACLSIHSRNAARSYLTSRSPRRTHGGPSPIARQCRRQARERHSSSAACASFTSRRPDSSVLAVTDA